MVRQITIKVILINNVLDFMVSPFSEFVMDAGCRDQCRIFFKLTRKIEISRIPAK